MKNWANELMYRPPWFRGLRRSDIRVAEPDLPPVRNWSNEVDSGMGRISELAKRPGNISRELYAEGFRKRRMRILRLRSHRQEAGVQKSRTSQGRNMEFSGLASSVFATIHNSFPVLSSSGYAEKDSPYSVIKSEIVAKQMGNQTQLSSPEF